LTAVGPLVQVRHELFVFRQGKEPQGLSRATSDHELIPIRRLQLTTELPGEGGPSLSIDSRLGLTYERRKVHASFTHFSTQHYTNIPLSPTLATKISNFLQKPNRLNWAFLDLDSWSKPILVNRRSLRCEKCEQFHHQTISVRGFALFYLYWAYTHNQSPYTEGQGENHALS
jgi:hypothetical protein